MRELQLHELNREPSRPGHSFTSSSVVHRAPEVGVAHFTDLCLK